MSAIIGALRGVLSLDSAAFDKGVDRSVAKMGKMERRMAQTGARMQKLGRKLSLGITAPMVAIGAAALKSSLNVVDSQAKMAQSLGTTVKSMQVLGRAADLSGVSIGEVEQATIALTKRLSQAAQGSGPAVKALSDLRLQASELQGLPLDERLGAIQKAMADYVPEAQRAAVASDLFGSRAGVVFSRIDTATLRLATEDVERFGVAVSESDADQIEVTNDAISRMGLAFRGVANQLTVAVAPAMESIANAVASVAAWFNGLGSTAQLAIGVMGGLAIAAGPVIAGLGLMASASAPVIRGVAGMIPAMAGAVRQAVAMEMALGATSKRAALSSIAIKGMSRALGVLKGAVIATGIGALVVGAGVLVNWFSKLVTATGGWGAALKLLGEVASGVWSGVSESAKAIPVALGAVWQTVRAGFFTMLEGLSKKWADFLHGIADSLKGVEGFEAAYEYIGTQAVLAGSKVYEFGHAATEASEAAEEAGKKAAAIASEGFAQAREAAGKLADAVSDTTDELGDGKDAASDLNGEISKLSNSGGKASKSLKGVKDAAQTFNAAMKEAAYTAEDWGKNRANTLISGIDGVANAWGDFVVSGFRDFSGFMDAVVSGFKSGLSQMIAMAARNQIMIGLGFGGTVAGGGAAAAVSSSGGVGIGNLLGLGNLAGGGFVSGIASGLGGILSGGGLGASFANLGGLMTGAVGGWGAIGAAIPAIGLVAVGLSALIGKTKELDRGLRVTVDGFDALVESFRDTQTSRLFGLIKSNRSSYVAADEEISDPIRAAVGEIQGNVLSMSDILGIGADAFSDFSAQIRISTKGLSDDEIAAEIQDQLAQIADGMAELALASYGVIRDGETASAALERLSTHLVSVQAIADTLGHTFDQTGVAGAALASALVDAFGGLDAMSAATTSYYQAFYSEAERQAITLRQMTEALSDLNITMPRSRDSYRALIEAQDLTTERGQEVYAALISMAAGMDQVLPAVSALTGELAALYGTTETGLNAFVSAAQTAAKANASAAADWYRASDSIRNYIDKLRGSSTSLTSPMQARSFNEMKFQTTLASALAGDLDAAGNLTSVAENLRLSVYDTASTRAEAALAEARILSGLNAASGIGDIEGARHDQISGLLTVQADLAQETIDYIAAGNVLTEDMIGTLQSQLGSLGGVIDYLSDGNVLTENMIDTLQSQFGSLGGEIGALMGDSIGLLAGDIDLSMSAFSDASGVLTRALSDLRSAVQKDIAIRAAAAKEQAFNTFAAQLGSHNGTLIANEDQLRSLARAGGLDASGSVAAVQSRVAGFSGSDNIDRVVTGADQISNYLFSVFRSQYVPTTDARYSQWYYGLPASHYDRHGRDEILAGLRSFKPRAFDWSAIGINIPGYAAGGFHIGGLRVVGENGPELEATGPSRIYSHDQTKRLLGGSDELQREMLSELRSLRDESRQLQMQIVSSNRQIAKLQKKWDQIGVPQGAAV